MPHAKNAGQLLCAAVVSIALPAAQLLAQPRSTDRTASIPIVVAEAMTFQYAVLGKTTYFDSRTPSDWPIGLVPAGATIIGGGAVGNSRQFRLRAAVFALPSTKNPSDVMRALLPNAGFTARTVPRQAPGNGGFVAIAPDSSSELQYCNQQTVATFQVLDSLQAQPLVAVFLIDGAAGRQACEPAVPAPRSTLSPFGSFPLTLPPLTAPSGTMYFNAGSSWSGESGHQQFKLRTTMRADSVLLHFTSQLVAGGWTAEGKPGVGDDVGSQRFTFRQGDQKWAAALFVLGSGDESHLMLQFQRRY